MNGLNDPLTSDTYESARSASASSFGPSASAAAASFPLFAASFFCAAPATGKMAMSPSSHSSQYSRM